MNLPFDLQVKILSYLPFRNLEVLAMRKVLPSEYIKKALKMRTIGNSYLQKKINVIENIVDNFYDLCFKCNQQLGYQYNIILCYHCSIDFENEIRYPVICHNCTDHKLNRGQFKYTFCSICNKPTSHLGITPLS